MSALTRYLKQKATIESFISDKDGTPVLDAYGQPTFKRGTVHRCRREHKSSVNTTGYGQFDNVHSTYYFDESVTVRVGDRVDGHLVQDVYEYVNGDGVIIGYEVIV